MKSQATRLTDLAIESRVKTDRKKLYQNAVAALLILPAAGGFYAWMICKLLGIE